MQIDQSFCGIIFYLQLFYIWLVILILHIIGFVLVKKYSNSELKSYSVKGEDFPKYFFLLDKYIGIAMFFGCIVIPYFLLKIHILGFDMYDLRVRGIVSYVLFISSIFLILELFLLFFPRFSRFQSLWSKAKIETYPGRYATKAERVAAGKESRKLFDKYRLTVDSRRLAQNEWWKAIGISFCGWLIVGISLLYVFGS